MTFLYNIDPARIDLFAVEGDAINMEFNIYEESTLTAHKFYAALNLFPSTGTAFNMQAARMQVRRKDGLLIKDWISGTSPADITLDPSSPGWVLLFDQSGFTESGYFDYDFQIDNGAGFMTIMTGHFWVKKQITIP
jgi:hypothetical protein